MQSLRKDPQDNKELGVGLCINLLALFFFSAYYTQKNHNSIKNLEEGPSTVKNSSSFFERKKKEKERVGL